MSYNTLLLESLIAEILWLSHNLSRPIINNQGHQLQMCKMFFNDSQKSLRLFSFSKSS